MCRGHISLYLCWFQGGIFCLHVCYFALYGGQGRKCFIQPRLETGLNHFFLLFGGVGLDFQVLGLPHLSQALRNGHGLYDSFDHIMRLLELPRLSFQSLKCGILLEDGYCNNRLA